MQYEQRQARAAPKKEPWLCPVRGCPFPKVKGDRCVQHQGASAVEPPAVARVRRGAAPRVPPRHSYGYEGSPLKWCSYCHKAHAREAFAADATRGDGLQANCRVALKKVREQYKARHPKGRYVGEMEVRE